MIELHTAIELFVWGFVLHNIADWFWQNDWMAVNKVNPRHPAGWIHAGLHAVILLLIFPVWAALAIGVIHWVIDLRFILTRWKHIFRQSIDGPVAIHVAIWQDQVAHWCVLALFAILVA